MARKKSDSFAKLSELAAMREKVNMYEGLLHDLQTYAEVALRGDLVRQLVINICNWSYAHRVGNGELTEAEQDRIIRRAFKKLRNVIRSDDEPNQPPDYQI